MKNKVAVIVENEINPSTGGDIIGLEIIRGLKNKFNVSTISLSSKNYSIKLFGERIINLLKIIEISKKIKRNDILIFNYFFDIASIILLLISWANRKKSIVVFHTMFKKGIPLVDFLYSLKKLFIINIAAILSDNLVFLTSGQKNVLVNYCFLKKTFNKKSTIIPNGVKMDSILAKVEKKNNLSILFNGRLNYQKGITTMQSLIEDQFRDYNITVLGKGKKSIINQITQYKGLIYIDYLDNKEIYKLYDKHNILILPSYSEVFPMVILEAMARGLVILVSDLPGMREIIKNGRNGYLFKPGDINRIKDILLYLKNNPREIQRISKNNLFDVKKFTTEKQIKKYNLIINKIIKDDKRQIFST